MNTQPTSGLQKLIVEHITTAVLVLDAEARFVYLNPAAEALFNISEKHAIGASLHQVIANTSDALNCIKKSLTTLTSYTERELHLQPTLAPDVVVDCSVTPLTENSTLFFLIEMIQLDRHLRISREEHLLSQQDVVHRLLRGLSHEIKNPLGGIRGAAQLLEAELISNEFKEFTKVIIGEADRLQKLVDRMLGPNQRPQKQLVNIHSILEHVRRLAQAEAPNSIEFRRDYDPSLPELFVDSDHIIQALLNIVRNAVQALSLKGLITLKTRVQRNFTIGQHRHNLVVRVDIIDNGPGIPKHLLDTIFYPMVTGRADGTGLGLAIAQSLVNRHCGLIECESREGKTQFTVWLPFDRSDKSETSNETV